MAQQEEDFEGESEDVALPPLDLKGKHRDVLGRILKVSAHPPRWKSALSALASVIKQRGGSICRPSGGSEVEFWVGSVRFLVDASHGGGDHDKMYPAQMTFLRKGLERAGVTLASLGLSY